MPIKGKCACSIFICRKTGEANKSVNSKTVTVLTNRGQPSFSRRSREPSVLTSTARATILLAAAQSALIGFKAEGGAKNPAMQMATEAVWNQSGRPGQVLVPFWTRTWIRYNLRSKALKRWSIGITLGKIKLDLTCSRDQTVLA